MPDLSTRLALQDLQQAYADALDTDQLELWPEFFVEDCLYEIIPKENVDAGLPAPLIRCDNRGMLCDRVVSLRHANIFQPAIYRHFLSGMSFIDRDDGLVAMQCNYLVINTTPAGDSVIFQVGRYLDLAVFTAEGWRFRQKRAVYDTSRVQTLLAIPV